MQKLWELRFALLRQRIRRRSKMGFGFGFSDFSTGFNIMGVFVTLMFVVVFGLFIVVAVKGISQWNKNNHSPRLTVAGNHRRQADQCVPSSPSQSRRYRNAPHNPLHYILCNIPGRKRRPDGTARCRSRIWNAD